MKAFKIILIVILCLVLAFAAVAGIYAGSVFGFFNKGNSAKYSVNNSPPIESALKGKTILFLGSSVTKGFAAKNESFVDYLAKQDGITAIKEAVNGTTLVDDEENSYVARLKTMDRTIRADAFVCQLSTNDASQKKPLGAISDSKDPAVFDTHTVAGAMEYIIAYAQEIWQCPVLFYTGTKYDNAEYEAMVDLLLRLQEKWNIGVIDLWHNEAMNNTPDAQKKIYMNDDVHPTRCGYRDWWLPVIRQALIEATAETA